MKGWVSTAARDTLAALVVSLAAVSFYLSAASLVFQGPLAPQLTVAIGAALAGGVVMSLFGAWKGSLPLASPGPEPATVPVLAALCSGVAGQVGGAALLPTVVASLAVASLAVGAAWWLLGARRWGDVIRYIPYPVIGGFLGSVGWLMVSGGLGVASGTGFGFRAAAHWVATADLRVASGLAIGALLWWGTFKIRHLLTLPALLVLFTLLLHAGLWGAGLDTDAARAQGWLLPPLGRTLPEPLLQPALLAQVDWLVVLREAGLIASIVIVATIALLLSDTSLEVAWDERADLNQDLRVLGQGNVAVAFAGALTGGISISRSVLNRAAGAAGRGSGVALAVVCTLVMLWGGPVVGLVPRPLLGGLLVFLGIGMLKTWLVDARVRLTRADYVTVAGMVAMTAVAGFLPAVCVGVLACCLDFAVAWARLAPVRRLVDRNDWPGRDERSALQMEHLRTHGARWRIVELQGALFFGSAIALVGRVEALLAQAPERLLFDFRHVRWLDSSGAQALGRLFKAAQKNGCEVHLSGLSPASAAALRAAGAAGDAGPPVHADIDTALGAWDESVLQAAGIVAPSLLSALAPALGSEAAAKRLLDAFEPLALAAGEVLFRQGDASDALYLVQSGRLAALVRQGDAEVAVRTSGPGATIGEMGLFRGRDRSATLRAEQPSVVLRLAHARLAELETQEPALASALYRFFLHQLAGRLDQSTAQAAALAR